MKVRKAVITAAGRNQRTLPLQMLIDRDGIEKPVLRIILDQALEAKVEEIAIVVCPGDEAAYAKAAGEQASRIRFLAQNEPLGYGHAVYCAREFTGAEPFLHLVGDHIYVNGGDTACARRVLEVAEAEDCSVSAVQPTRETQIGHYGAIGGQRVHGREGLYRIDTVIEKPTPTEAEQSLAVAGLRAGFYLCFFGMHVFTPAVMESLGTLLAANAGTSLSAALADLSHREQYLALDARGRRYDLGVRYGLLTAQVALALAGRDRAEVLANLLELVAGRSFSAAAAS